MSSPGERLTGLARLVGGRVEGDGQVLVTDVTHDSRQAGPGCLFVAVRGAAHDGHDFVQAAVDGGAAALCVDHPLPAPVPLLVVPDTRAAMGAIAAEVHGRPSEQLDLVGVTGTNGKTSVTYVLESIGARAGRTTGVIGTIQTRVGGDVLPTLRTTPEAPDLQRLLRRMLDRGADLVAAEVSSHALALGRVDGARFAVAAFTNLSQDHLDFHGDMERYFLAKASLFAPERSRHAVVWVDDAHGARLAGMVEVPLTTVALDAPADVRGELRSSDVAGSDIRIRFPEGPTLPARVPLPGRFNVANALVAAAAARAVGVSPDAIVEGISAAPPVPGRFELVSGEDPVRVVVDYAHTPAGIERAIEAARELASGAVIAVLGAGGDRDRAKRPLMGAAAAAADRVVVTSDNPRSEDPERIVDEVLAGVGRREGVVRLPDRRDAIAAAVEAARPGDVVLVLGKGHERGQEVRGRVLPFDDRVVARAELARVRGRSR